MNKIVRATVIVFIIIALLILSVIIIGRIFFYSQKYTLGFEKVTEIDRIPDDNDLYWFTLRHEEYNGFYDVEMLENLSSNIGDVDNIDFDYDNYTYVITIGHELKSISYSYSDVKNRKFLFIPKQFVGNVVLDSKETDKLYIYKIKKMDIDCDYHDRDVGVNFSD